MSMEKEVGANAVIAVPVTDGRLCAHFGHCERFTLFDVDTTNKEIVNSRQLDPPVHQPGVLPRWLQNQGVNVVIAGGMGGRAQNMFTEQGIDVHVGAPTEQPDSIVQDYLDGKLRLGENTCDH